MSIFEAILLGLIQGLTEFIPVSSTAHLTLAGRALDLVDPAQPEAWTAFLAVVQLGTLAAVLVYFRRDIADIARGMTVTTLARIGGRTATPSETTAARLGWLVGLGTLPIVVIALLFRDTIEGPLTKNLWIIAASLIALAVVLLIAERVGRRARGVDTLTIRDALIVGGAQVFALIPGASRSGTTIAGGLFAGLDREAAARFSFLLSIPAIAGSAVFELPAALASSPDSWATLSIAILASAISGYLAIDFLLRYLRRHPTHVFAGYRIVLGAGLAALLWTGRIAA